MGFDVSSAVQVYRRCQLFANNQGSLIVNNLVKIGFCVPPNFETVETITGSLSELIIDDDCFAVTQCFEGDSLLFKIIHYIINHG